MIVVFSYLKVKRDHVVATFILYGKCRGITNSSVVSFTPFLLAYPKPS